MKQHEGEARGIPFFSPSPWRAKFYNTFGKFSFFLFSSGETIFVESTIHFVKHWLNIKKKLQYNFCMALSLTNATITKRKT